MKKKLMLFIVSASLITGSVFGAVAQTKISAIMKSVKIMIGDTQIMKDKQIIEYKNITYIPFKDYSKELGLELTVKNGVYYIDTIEEGAEVSDDTATTKPTFDIGDTVIAKVDKKYQDYYKAAVYYTKLKLNTTYGLKFDQTAKPVFTSVEGIPMSVMGKFEVKNNLGLYVQKNYDVTFYDEDMTKYNVIIN